MLGGVGSESERPLSFPAAHGNPGIAGMGCLNPFISVQPPISKPISKGRACLPCLHINSGEQAPKNPFCVTRVASILGDMGSDPARQLFLDIPRERSREERILQTGGRGCCGKLCLVSQHVLSPSRLSFVFLAICQHV